MRPLLAALLLLAALGPVDAASLAPLGTPAGRIETLAKPASAETRPFRLGIVGGPQGAGAIEAVEPFRAHLAARLDVEVQVTRFSDERDLVGALVADRIDYAPLSALGFARALRLCDGCAEALAAPRDADRNVGWRVLVVARAHGPIARLDDLSGRATAIPGGEEIGPRRLALAAFADAGLTGPRAPKMLEVGGPAAALAALGEARAEAAVIWGGADGGVEDGFGRGPLAAALARGEVQASTLRLVWASQVLPYGPHTVRAGLAEPTKRRLRDMLLELDTDRDAYEAIEPIHAGGFLRVGAAAYAPFVRLLTPPAGRAGRDETAGAPPTRP